MTSPYEVAANVVNAAAILLATLNSVHTWWTGIIGCLLFGWVFFSTQLYADATLQLFFVVTCAVGWWSWLKGNAGKELPVSRTPLSVLIAWLAAALAIALIYGAILHRFTDAFAPFLDSLVLTFSVLAQLLLMRRRYETWWFWLVVNTIAVPLFYSRGLELTALLYVAFWINAVVALVRWRRYVVS